MQTTRTFLCAALVALAGCCLWAASSLAQEEFDELPLDGVIADMQVAGGRLGKLLTDKPTQQKQQDAIDKLNTLIKVLEQQRQQRGNGNRSGPNPDEPAEDSMIKSGPGGSGPLHEANRKGRDWGQLPAHKREQILQSMSEGFPAHYQQLLERYYRRLAEERPADDLSTGEEPVGDPAPKPETKPETKDKPVSE